jgi:hypothetical protein
VDQTGVVDGDDLGHDLGQVDPRRCPECGFEATRWTDQDTVTTAGVLEALMAPYVT